MVAHHLMEDLEGREREQFTHLLRKGKNWETRRTRRTKECNLAVSLILRVKPAGGLLEECVYPGRVWKVRRLRKTNERERRRHG